MHCIHAYLYIYTCQYNYNYITYKYYNGMEIKFDVNQSCKECESILAKNCFTSGESLSKQVSRKVYSRKLNKLLHPLG